MLKKTLLFAAASLGFSGAALAHPPQWAPAHGWRGHHEYEHSHYRPYYVPPRAVYVAPRPVYVVPAPRVVYAAPPAPVVYSAPPAPVVYSAPVPVYPAPVYGSPSFSIRLNLPL